MLQQLQTSWDLFHITVYYFFFLQSCKIFYKVVSVHLLFVSKEEFSVSLSHQS